MDARLARALAVVVLTVLLAPLLGPPPLPAQSGPIKIGFLAPLILSAPEQAEAILDTFTEWGINRFALDLDLQDLKSVLDSIEECGFDLTICGVAGLERFAGEVTTRQHQGVEHEIDYGCGARAEVLERVERWTTFFVERDNFAVDDGLVRELRKAANGGWISRAEVVVVA